MFKESNTKTNLPAQIDLYATKGDAYKFLYMAKVAQTQLPHPSPLDCPPSPTLLCLVETACCSGRWATHVVAGDE